VTAHTSHLSSAKSGGRRVALSFLAHPDDAEILCAGTMIRLRQEHDYELHIVTATAGDCGTISRSPAEIAAVRCSEAAQSAALIGASYRCLSELDGFVVYDKPTIRKVIDLFREIAATIVFTHAPADYMVDHEQVSLLARGASFISAAPNASRQPLITGHGIPHLYYCDPIEGIDPLGTRVQPTTYVALSKEVHALKLRMLACHASQREWLRAHHGMDEYLDAVERHDRLRAADAIQPGHEFAEAFTQHRGHAYPQEDLLAQLFPRSH
jgi:4-oxalomesaconate hydratase